MGAISGSLLGLDGMAGLRGWQWAFLVQGLPAVLLGLSLLRLLPDAPATAPCWRTVKRNGSAANWLAMLR
jgi:ACS family tartrate transporter-like MFS transporter